MQKKYHLFFTACGIFFLWAIPQLNSFQSEPANSYQKSRFSSAAEYERDRIRVKLKRASDKAHSLASQKDAFYVIPSLKQKVETFEIVEIKKVFPEETGPLDPAVPDLSTVFEMKIHENQNIFELLEAFSNDQNVQYAEPCFIRYIDFTPNDSLLANQYYLELIKADSAWDLEQGDSSVVMAIVDTGVEWRHPDLAANIWRNSGEIPDNGLDDDHNGYIDDVRGWDFGDNDSDPTNMHSAFEASHGTLVAGVAGAVTNNETGIAGVGFNCKIMPVKVISDAAEDQRQLRFGFAGIKYAADNGADIINASWGGPGHSRFEDEVIQYALAKGSLIVASAGNRNSESRNYPAAYAKVLSVAATDRQQTKAKFSTFGYWVDLAAPGVNILTTNRSDDFLAVNGTSFSSPIVSGAAALVKSRNPSWGALQVGEQVRATASSLDLMAPSYLGKLGRGMVNAWSALTEKLPSIRIEEIQTRDTEGDGDGILEPGETIEVKLTLKNYLSDAQNVLITLESISGMMNLLDEVIQLTGMSHGEVVAQYRDGFKIRIDEGAGRGSRFNFIVNISSDNGRYRDRDHFVLTVAPQYGEHDVGNVVLTVSSTGNFGFTDYPDNVEGSGFVFNADGINLLNEGAFLAATGPTKVSDVAREHPIGTKSHDFDVVTNGTIVFTTPGTLADQQSIARFADTKTIFTNGIEVTQECFSFSQPPFDDFVLVKYRIKNTRQVFVSNLYVGLFFDWNIDQVGAATNRVDYDPKLSLGYMYSSFFPTYCGLKVLNERGAVSYRAIDNEVDLNDEDGFTDQEKFQFLSEGFQKTTIATPGDYSHLIATGPFQIPRDSVVVAGFAILAGTGLENLKAHAMAAQMKWEEIIGTNLPGNLPNDFALQQNFPNPFNPATTIPYRLPLRTHVTIKIYNLLGQEIATLVDETKPAGRYQVQWEGKNHNGLEVATGIYLIQMKTEVVNLHHKMLLLR
ncbi:MAG: S8 family serine peptidase [bacterium]